MAPQNRLTVVKQSRFQIYFKGTGIRIFLADCNHCFKSHWKNGVTYWSGGNRRGSRFGEEIKISAWTCQVSDLEETEGGVGLGKKLRFQLGLVKSQMPVICSKENVKQFLVLTFFCLFGWLFTKLLVSIMMNKRASTINNLKSHCGLIKTIQVFGSFLFPQLS